jgi:drug/metabolite transporter (DMT)-like permease
MMGFGRRLCDLISFKATYLMTLPALETLFVVLWSTGFVVVEFAFHDAQPFTILFWRYAMLGTVLIVWAGLSGALARLRWSDLRAAAISGLLAHLAWLGAIYWAQNLGVPPGHAALVAALQPLLTGVLSGRVVGERVRPREWLGLGLGFVGVSLAIVSKATVSPNVPLGAYALPFVPVITLTAAVLLERRNAIKRNPDLRAPAMSAVMAVQSAVTAAGALPLAWSLEGLATTWTPQFLLALAWLAGVSSLGSYGLLWLLVARTNATRASSLFYFTPPTAMIMAWLFLGDGLTVTDLVGLTVSGGIGVVLVRLPINRLSLRAILPRKTDVLSPCPCSLAARQCPETSRSDSNDKREIKAG